MMKWIISFIFIFTISTQSFAVDFEKVDKYARSVRKSGDYKQLARKLTKPFTKEQEKVRAIYVWITDNVKYDWKKFQSNLKTGGRYHVKGRSKSEVELKKKKRKKKKINKVFRTGKGVCEDYSLLFKAMCDEVGIETVLINGKIRVDHQKIGVFPSRSRHAWNAIKIDDKWYLVDATWGAGYVRNGKFHKKFESGYFMTKPEIFILNHYPNDPKWQLLETPVSKKEFSDFAFIHSYFFDYNAVDFYPKYGFLNAKEKFEIVKIKFENTPPDIYIFKNKKIKNVEYTINGNEIEVKIPTLAKYYRPVSIVTKKGKKILPLLEYKIK